MIEARARRPGLIELVVEVDGAAVPALAYEDLCGPVSSGNRVLLNTTAVDLGLGSGGVHFVIAVEGATDLGGRPAGSGMKLRYTPLQVPVRPVEEIHPSAIDSLKGLGGMPVVAAGLHSGLAPAVIGAKAERPSIRLAYLMTDAGALPLAFSDAVAALRAEGVLEATITCGQAFGGDLEAVNIWSGLAAARAVVRADAVVVAMGPGNLGTGTRLGFALMEVAQIVDAAGALGGRPVVAPRLSFADPRPRHRGISHHTTTALELCHAAAEIALPPLAADRSEVVRAQLAADGLRRHGLVEVDLGAAEEALARSTILRSMGRTYADDPDYFRAGAAAGVLAARMVAAGVAKS